MLEWLMLELNRAQDDIKQAMAGGSCSDYAAYQRMVGRYDSLVSIAEWAREMTRKVQIDDEDE